MLLEMAKAPVFRPELLKCRLFCGVDGSLLPILAQTLKTQGAVHLGEQGVVSADAHVGAGMDLGAALADQNVAGEDELTVTALHAQTLGVGVTAVLGGAEALLMSEELNRNLHRSLHLQNSNVVGVLLL